MTRSTPATAARRGTDTPTSTEATFPRSSPVPGGARTSGGTDMPRGGRTPGGSGTSTRGRGRARPGDPAYPGSGGDGGDGDGNAPAPRQPDGPDLLLAKAHYPVTTLGPGVRAGIWTQGCTIGCPGCLSRDTWDPDPRTAVPVSAVLGWLASLPGPVEGVTISGGEPFQQPEALAALLRGIHEWRAAARPVAAAPDVAHGLAAHDPAAHDPAAHDPAGHDPADRDGVDRIASAEGVAAPAGAASPAVAPSRTAQAAAARDIPVETARPAVVPDVLVYSGYAFSRLARSPRTREILALCDAVVAGPYVARRGDGGPLKGSANQRLVPLTDLGHRRYDDIDVAAAERPRIQVSVDAGPEGRRIYYIGIPRRGDMDRLNSTLERAGVHPGDVSWRP